MTNENLNDYRHLEELSGSEYEIADGEPDIKGWDIKDKLGAKLGKVDDLLFNPATQKVRYLIAALDGRVFGIENRKVLIPVGLAELHESEDDVYLPGITVAQLAAAPDYYKGKISVEHEIAVRNAYTGEFINRDIYDEQTFYEHDHYNERNLFGRRFTGGENGE
ncbi:PRC-barrel domain-containing protein [Pedobacter sp. L105]|uniref:PRC-barrel domain-containing protein n=1 Tax=Pedobacter sp. L105 TaxID=1641871 RepID=UPI00131AD768|nr:PRC-barrel domain-containing protein [Pedobacter sp. L105]